MQDAGGNGPLLLGTWEGRSGGEFRALEPSFLFAQIAVPLQSAISISSTEGNRVSLGQPQERSLHSGSAVVLHKGTDFLPQRADSIPALTNRAGWRHPHVLLSFVHAKSTAGGQEILEPIHRPELSRASLALQEDPRTSRSEHLWELLAPFSGRVSLTKLVFRRMEHSRLLSLAGMPVLGFSGTSVLWSEMLAGRAASKVAFGSSHPKAMTDLGGLRAVREGPRHCCISPPITSTSHTSTPGTATISFLVAIIPRSCPGSQHCRRNMRKAILNLSIPGGPKIVGLLLQSRGKIRREAVTAEQGDRQCLEKRRERAKGTKGRFYQPKSEIPPFLRYTGPGEVPAAPQENQGSSRGCQSLRDQGAQVPAP